MDGDAASDDLDGCTVLIVEDQFLIAEEMRSAIEQLGARVMGPVGTTVGALRLLQHARPDIAVLDVDLGGERVYPVADALVARAVPFVFTTGFDVGTVDRRYGNALHLEKPVRMAALSRALRELRRQA